MKANWDDYSQDMESMFQATQQISAINFISLSVNFKSLSNFSRTQMYRKCQKVCQNGTNDCQLDTCNKMEYQNISCNYNIYIYIIYLSIFDVCWASPGWHHFTMRWKPHTSCTSSTPSQPRQSSATALQLARLYPLRPPG